MAEADFVVVETLEAGAAGAAFRGAALM
jgi:hypothetical protein